MKKMFLVVLSLFVCFSYKSVYADTLCKRATTLHTEECSTSAITVGQCLYDGYTVDGAKKTTTITYGNLGKYGILKSGDAFDCDVNGDGKYDSATERFYYVTDLNNDTAVMFFYNNVVNGVANTKPLQPFTNFGYGHTNYEGPNKIINFLPTVTQWKNVSLKQPIRAIVSQKNESFINIRTDVYNLPTSFSYEGYAARLLTYQEIDKSCTLGGNYNLELQDCNYLLENLNYSGNHYSVYDRMAYFLENPCAGSYNCYNVMIVDYTKNVGSSNGDYPYGARPVIEVPKDRIEGSTNIDIQLKSNNGNFSLSGKTSELYNKKLEVKEYSKDSDIYKRISNIFVDKNKLFAYNFNLYDESNKLVELDSKIRVNIKLPENLNKDKLKLWYITEDYSRQELSYIVKDNILSFETDCFSIYALTEDADGEIVKVEDTAFSITKLGITIGLVILVLGIMVIIQTILKEKK